MIRIFRHYISRAYLWLLLIEFCMFFSAMYFGSSVRFFNDKVLVYFRRHYSCELNFLVGSELVLFRFRFI